MKEKKKLCQTVCHALVVAVITLVYINVIKKLIYWDARYNCR